MRKIFSLFLIFFVGFSYAQELNCTVTVNADQISVTNRQVFTTLQKSLTDFINKNDWTGRGYKPNERINCSMFINITAVSGTTYTATLQVQSSRTAYNSTYSSPIFNFNDKEFTFDYTEFQNLNFNQSSFESNLVSVVSFYAYMIIGLDADSFAPEGGTDYFSNAQEIVAVAQTGGYKGWSGNDGNSNRFFLVNDLLSPTFAPYRQAMYQYHFEGMDNMNSDLKASKEKIKTALVTLSQIYSVRPNAFILRVFFDAKSDEIVSVFSGGPQITITDVVENLNRISPLNSTKWAAIKQ